MYFHSEDIPTQALYCCRGPPHKIPAFSYYHHMCVVGQFSWLRVYTALILGCLNETKRGGETSKSKILRI